MRYILFSVLFILVAFVIRMDLQHGTVQLASFYQETQPCEPSIELQFVRVTVQPLDTLHTLFAMTPSPHPVTFPERLTAFYKLNPHLQKQPLLAGETVSLPLFIEQQDSCN